MLTEEKLIVPNFLNRIIRSYRQGSLYLLDARHVLIYKTNYATNTQNCGRGRRFECTTTTPARHHGR